MKNGLILITDRLTAADIPLLTQYSPFVITKEPITDQDVIRALSKKNILGISGVDSISDLQVTLGKEPIQINGSFPISQIVDALNGKCDVQTVETIPAEVEEEVDVEEEEPDDFCDIPSDPLSQRIAAMEAAIETLTNELRRSFHQVIIRDDAASSKDVCNADVFRSLELGYYMNNVG